MTDDPSRSDPVSDAKHNIGTLAKALDVLEAFTHERPEWGLSELSRELNIGKATLHRLLRTLESRGYLVQHPATRRYRLGFKAVELASTAISSSTPIEVARHWIRSLGAELGEQVTLWVYDAGTTVCVDKEEGRNRVRTHTNLGDREDAWLMASGRCLLAYQPDEEIERVAASLPPDGLFDAPALRQRLREVREGGYDISRGDRWADVCAVSAAIFDHHGAAVAAITLSVVVSRFTEEFATRATKAVRTTANDISTELGATRLPSLP